MPKISNLLRLCFSLALALPGLAAAPPKSSPTAPARFAVRFAPSLSAQPLDGRLFLLLSTDPNAEPRMQIGESPDSQLIFGTDVEGLPPGQRALVDARADGYPIRSLKDLPPGDYTVQALLHRYETFHRADGHTLKLPMDRGEGQHWNLAPGNLYSRPRKVHVGPGQAPIQVLLDQVIPPLPDIPDSKYVRHLRIQSQLLTKFWGRPMFLSALVLVPEGFDAHPEARFPMLLMHDHFVRDFEDSFRTVPPDPNLKPDYSERFRISGYNRIQQEEAYRNFQQWTAPDFPRYLFVKLQHANPYYDDSYAVNSANLGPYGDAIETELMPAIEKAFRVLPTWARFLCGGSTGGWESLAAQIFYPDHYNGAFGSCPDPVDFRAYTVIDLYKDKNAFYLEGAHKRVAQPAARDYLGHTFQTLEEFNTYELALGSHGRSGEQFDIWQAVFSPQGADGYPKPIFDKRTGLIDPKVAAYWQEHYDLRAILEKNWPVLGPKLRGKLHVYCGSADTFFLNDAVYLLEDFLKQTTQPPYEGEVKYGDRAEHCWNGDPGHPNHISRLHYSTLYLDKMLKRMEKTAPVGADLKSWRY